MRTVGRFPVAGLFAAVVAIGASQVAGVAQDPVKIASNNYKVVLENDSVRVLEITAKAGEKIAKHDHPDYVTYVIGGGKVKFTAPDGKTTDVELKQGEATWHKTETHEPQNIGTTDLKLVVIELKKPAVAGAKPAAIPAAEDQAKVAADSAKVLLDNDRVRVFDVRLKPGGKMAKHSHPASVVYAMTDCKIKVTTFPGDKVEEKTLSAGKALWNEPTTHTVENVGAGEAHVLNVELK